MLTQSIPGEEKSETSSLAGGSLEEDLDGGKLSKGQKKRFKRRKLKDVGTEHDEAMGEKTKKQSDKRGAPSSASSATAANAPAEEKEQTENGHDSKDKGKGKERRARIAKGKFCGFTEDQMHLMGLIMKMVMQLTQKNRDAEAVLFETFLAPSNDELILAMAVQGRRFARAVEEPGHGLGSPHLYVFGALLKAIADLALDPLDKSRYEEYSRMPLEERNQVIRLCKQAKTYDGEVRKLAMAFGTGDVALPYKSRLVKLLIDRENWSYKMGRAPPGYMEREMSNFLANMVS